MLQIWVGPYINYAKKIIFKYGIKHLKYVEKCNFKLNSGYKEVKAIKVKKVFAESDQKYIIIKEFSKFNRSSLPLTNLPLRWQVATGCSSQPIKCCYSSNKSGPILKTTIWWPTK